MGCAVLWSEIDVAVADRTVTSISATTVPFTQLAADRRPATVSRARAQAIASVPCAAREHDAEAQAGRLRGHAREAVGDAARSGLGGSSLREDRGADAATRSAWSCDGGTGKVLMRYKGFASQDAGRRRIARQARPRQRPSTPFAAALRRPSRDRASAT